MYVRLANDWTGPDHARHRAGDLVEVDNVLLAELEAGGFVATEEEFHQHTARRSHDREPETKEPETKPAPTGPDRTGDGDEPDGANPDQTSWPPIT